MPAAQAAETLRRLRGRWGDRFLDIEDDQLTLAAVDCLLDHFEAQERGRAAVESRLRSLAEDMAKYTKVVHAEVKLAGPLSPPPGGSQGGRLEAGEAGRALETTQDYVIRVAEAVDYLSTFSASLARIDPRHMLPLGVPYGEAVVGRLAALELEIYDLLLQYEREAEVSRRLRGSGPPDAKFSPAPSTAAHGQRDRQNPYLASSHVGEQRSAPASSTLPADSLLDTMERLAQVSQDGYLADLDSYILKLNSEASVDRARAERAWAREEAAELQRKTPLSRVRGIKAVIEFAQGQLSSLRAALEEHAEWKYVPAESNEEIRAKIEELRPEVRDLQIQMDKLALLDDVEREGGDIREGGKGAD